jgi:serine/threonine protein kinase
LSNSLPEILGGRYQIMGRLGRGGMANIFRAKDLNLQREVAIKIMHDQLIEDPSFQASFLREARAAANLSHPNIVTIFDFGHDGGRYFLVMEYIPGTDLKTLIRRKERLETMEAVDLMIQICAGVGYAHRAGLIHCDLKPQNVLITADGRAKITDFGIARALATISADEQADIVWGSPIYFAPEQAAGGPPSPASDVYALGITLFEMLAGRPPFQANDSMKLAELHQTSPPPFLRAFVPEVPDPLEQMLLKVLSKEPSARYRTADQFGRVLTTFAKSLRAADSYPVEEALPEQPDNDPQAYTAPLSEELEQEPSIDWVGVGLGLLAFIAVGGLIPLWLYVCLLYPTCPFNPG